MDGVFDKHLWNAPLYRTHAEAAAALEGFRLGGRRIKHIHALGAAEDLRLEPFTRIMRGRLLDEVGVPAAVLNADAYPYAELLRAPLQVELCEPVVIVFEDGATLELLPHANGGMWMSMDHIGGDVVHGTNHANFDSDRLFARLKGHTVQRLETIVQTTQSSAHRREHRVTTHRFELDGGEGFFLRRTTQGWYTFGLTRPFQPEMSAVAAAAVPCGELKAARLGMTQVIIAECRGDFDIAPVPAENADITGAAPDCISLEESAMQEFVYFFLQKHYDPVLNDRYREPWYGEGFEWNGNNCFTYASMRRLLAEMECCADMLQSDYDNPLLDALKRGFCAESFDERYAQMATEGRPSAGAVIRANRHVAIDFYRRFARRMRSMMSHAPQFELICVCGP